MRLLTTLLVLVAVALSFGDVTRGADSPDYGAIAKELKRAVKAGKLTKEEAAAKLAALKKAAAAKGKEGYGPEYEKSTDYDAIAKKLFELVRAGLLSEEQAKAMLAAAREVGNAKKAD